MTTSNNSTFVQLNKVLRPFGITRNLRSHQLLCDCLERIFEQEDRLNAVQKEIYMPIGEMRRCDWSAVQSAVRRAAQTAWQNNPDAV